MTDQERLIEIEDIKRMFKIAGRGEPSEEDIKNCLVFREGMRAAMLSVTGEAGL